MEVEGIGITEKEVRKEGRQKEGKTDAARKNKITKGNKMEN